MKILCPACQQPIAGEDIDVAKGIAVCRPCSEVVALVPPLGARALATSASAELTEDIRPSDLRWTEVDRPFRLVGAINLRSFLKALPLFGFALFWDSFLVVWYSLALFGNIGRGAIVALLFPLLHVGAGVLITYQAFATALNRAELTLDRQRFAFAVRPLPSSRRVEHPTEEIVQFVAAPCDASAKKQASNDSGVGEIAWTVQVITRDHTSIALGLSLPTQQHARFVAGRLNQKLQAMREPVTYRG